MQSLKILLTSILQPRFYGFLILEANYLVTYLLLGISTINFLHQTKGKLKALTIKTHSSITMTEII